MSSIKISELHPTGLDLFHDSESFLNELTDQEIGEIKGGEVLSQGTVSVEITVVTVSAAVVNSNNVQIIQRELSPEEMQLLNQALDSLWQITLGIF